MDVVRTWRRGLAALMLVSAAAPAWATNGMYLAGYGSEAAGRGGVNIAVADRALGLQSNPAGIAQLQGQHLGVDLQLLAPRLAYGDDPLGNQLDGESALFAMPSLSWVRGGVASRWTYGLGLISQGGMGATFEGYATPFGSTDGTSSEVRFLTVTPTVAFALTPDVAVGVSANLGYSDVTFRFYPNTSFYSDNGTPADPSDDVGFFGLDLAERAKALNASGRVGVMWRANEYLQVGAVYQTKTTGEYENGTLRSNMAAIGLGAVSYDATVDGFTWPDQFGLGVQVRPAARWMVAADVKRYGWKDAMDVITVKGTDPDKPAPYLELEVPFAFRWEDQWVFGVGTEYRVSPALTLRGGYDHGGSPVPDGTLNPLFPATTVDHATLGLGWTWAANTLNVAVERAFEATQTNLTTDPNLNPFGPGMRVDHSQWTLSVGFTRAFSGR